MDYCKYTLEEYNQVMNLRKNFGWGPTKISSFLFDKGINIKEGAIIGWIHKNKRPYEEVLIKKIPEESKILTEEKAYILGVLCGDGYLTFQKEKSRYLIGLDVCDEDFADEFRRCLKEVYGLLPSKILRNRRVTNFSKNPKLMYCIYLTSKLVVEDLLRYSKSFKTKEWTVPEEILNSSIEIKSAFLRGLFDSEGTIIDLSKGRAILQLCSGNDKSLLVIKDILLNDFGVNTKIDFNNNKVMQLRTYRYENIKNFSDKIGFTIKRKKEKLAFCLSSYKRKGLRKYNQDFKANVLQLLSQGFSAYKIGKILKFPHTNVYDFVKQQNRLIKE